MTDEPIARRIVREIAEGLEGATVSLHPDDEPDEPRRFFAERDCPVCKTHLYKEGDPFKVVFCGCGHFEWR